MSHLSKVQVSIRDIDVLGEALKALGLRCVGQVDENYEFANTFNQCDVIAVNAINNGFKSVGYAAVSTQDADKTSLEHLFLKVLKQRGGIQL